MIDMNMKKSYAELESDYIKTFDMYCHGIITKDEWTGYCFSLLERIAILNKDVLDRLKEN